MSPESGNRFRDEDIRKIKNPKRTERIRRIATRFNLIARIARLLRPGQRLARHGEPRDDRRQQAKQRRDAGNRGKSRIACRNPQCVEIGSEPGRGRHAEIIRPGRRAGASVDGCDHRGRDSAVPAAGGPVSRDGRAVRSPAEQAHGRGAFARLCAARFLGCCPLVVMGVNLMTFGKPQI